MRVRGGPARGRVIAETFALAETSGCYDDLKSP
jgi:hypothetical protein